LNGVFTVMAKLPCYVLVLISYSLARSTVYESVSTLHLIVRLEIVWAGSEELILTL